MDVVQMIKNGEFDVDFKSFGSFSAGRRAQWHMKEKFLKCCLKQHGFEEDNEKARKLFQLCWEERHGSGLMDVYNMFLDFSDLIK